MPSTFEVITGIGAWVNNGTVIFPDKDVTVETPESLLAGYYPPAGTVFEVTAQRDVLVPNQPLYSWQDSAISKLEPSPVTRRLRTLKMKVTNPQTLVNTGNDPLRAHFPPQVRLDEEFVREFAKLEFTAINDEFMVSSPLILTQINFRDATGRITETRREIHSIVFVLGHRLDAAGKPVMISQVLWDGSYRAFYGCCGWLRRLLGLPEASGLLS